MFGSVIENFRQKVARLKARAATLGVVTDGLLALLRVLDAQIEALMRQRDLMMQTKDESGPAER